MLKKTVKKTAKPLSPRPAVKQDDTAYVVREDLEAQQERPGQTAGAGAGVPKAPEPPVADQAPGPAAVPSKPLAPLAALWPSSVAPRGEASPSRGPASPKTPAGATAAKPAVAQAPPSPRLPAQSAPPRSPGTLAAPTQGPKPTGTPTVNVKFSLHKPDAKQVLLGGDFNGWALGAAPMKRHEDGHWETTVPLAPGCYQYKFLIDGQWVTDPAAQKNVPNQYGTLNSVIEVRA
jgi:hypothetical protein